MDVSDIEDDIHVMTVTASTKSRQNSLVDITSQKTLNEKKKQTLPALNEFPIAQNTDTYCDKFSPTVRILG